MKRQGSALIAALLIAATPAAAATGPFFSLHNTNFIVLIAFLIFVGILLYAGVPGKLAGLLDRRAATIHAELEEARSLREEAQSILASYERKSREVQDQASRIVADARTEAQAAAEQAKVDLAATLARRLVAAEDQIASAEASAVREVRDQAVAIAVAAARDVIGKSMTAAEGDRLIDTSINEIERRLH